MSPTPPSVLPSTPWRPLAGAWPHNAPDGDGQVGALRDELRMPIMAILGPVEDLLAGHHGALNGPQRQQLEALHRAALRLLDLVEEKKGSGDRGQGSGLSQGKGISQSGVRADAEPALTPVGKQL